MNLKKITLKILDVMGVFWQLFPSRFRVEFITLFIILDSRGVDKKDGLRRLFKIHDRLEWVTNERALAYGCGEHPKHWLIQYHNFFIEHINDGESVLDVGCGYGAVSRSIAFARPNSQVTGIDWNSERLTQAKESTIPQNLSFIEGDACSLDKNLKVDVVVLSNVLEHITERVEFLIDLQKSTNASRYLIRVPLFERDWKMGLRESLGVDFRSDEDHKIEHKLNEFLDEIAKAGLLLNDFQTLWGEIWASCQMKY
jgi:2-polyprenyl-3-methyl-5-hydroxy-6-metoxy-1,4-benzoquinol methylase